MNTKIHIMNVSKTLIATTVATLITACAAAPQQRESARLDARTREADAAQGRVAAIRAESVERTLSAEKARGEAAAAQAIASFASGQADVKPGAVAKLERLIAFLNEYPDRTVAIEGHTDSVGEEGYNQGLSQRRADTVKDHLVGDGIGSLRVSASGLGERDPVAGNDSAADRQQNRRVEIIVSNHPFALR